MSRTATDATLRKELVRQVRETWTYQFVSAVFRAIEDPTRGAPLAHRENTIRCIGHEFVKVVAATQGPQALVYAVDALRGGSGGLGWDSTVLDILAAMRHVRDGPTATAVAGEEAGPAEWVAWWEEAVGRWRNRHEGRGSAGRYRVG